MKERILIIEDEEDLVKGLKLNLNDEGYEVSWAFDGEEGLRKTIDSGLRTSRRRNFMMPEKATSRKR